MELVYSVSSKTPVLPPFRRFAGKCAVSVKNVLAIIAQCEQREGDNGNGTASGADIDWCHAVYVCDLNTPWDAHEVAKLRCAGVALQWSPCATRLACGDSFGNIRIWAQKDGLLNEWIEVHAVTYVKEPVTSLAWLHNGRKLVTAVEHKSVEQHRTYQDKFESQGLSPTFKQFGGTHLDGIMFITSLGRAVTLTLPLDLVTGEVLAENLHPLASCKALDDKRVDWTYLKSGGYLVALADGGGLISGESVIFSRIRYSFTRGETKMHAETVGRFNLNSNNIPDAKISYLRFLGREDSKTLLIVTKAKSGGSSEDELHVVELDVRDEDDPRGDDDFSPSLAKLFVADGSKLKKEQNTLGIKQENSSGEEQAASNDLDVDDENSMLGGMDGEDLDGDVDENTARANKAKRRLAQLNKRRREFAVTGKCVSKWTAPGEIGVLRPPDSVLDKHQTRPTAFILVHVVDKGTLHCLVRDHSGNVGEVKSLSYPPSPVAVSKKISPTKRLRLSPTEIPIVDLAFTATGTCAVGIDARSSVVLFRLSPLIDPGGPASVSWCSALLEYCLVSGWDWWDVLISLCRPSLAEAVLERVTDSFYRQPPGYQTAFKLRFQSVKLTLERVLAANSVGSGAVHQARSVACSVLIMLGCVTAQFRSVLRASDVLQSDKGPAELLSAKIVQTPLQPDINKMCLQVDPKQFYVDAASLQSLQPLIQWVVDLCLWLVASFAQISHKGTNVTRPALEILRDTRAVCTLRELLVTIRLWGCARQQCLPVVVKAVESLDVIVVLYRILTRIILHQSIDATNDENLLEECALLSSQVMVPPIHLDLPAKGLIVEPFSLHKMKRGRPPKGLDGRPVSDDRQSEGVADRRAILRDAVRHLYLGKNPEMYRECTRCGARSALGVSSSIYLQHLQQQMQNQHGPGGGAVSNTPITVRMTAAARAWDQRWACGCFCGGYWILKRQRSTVGGA